MGRIPLDAKQRAEADLRNYPRNCRELEERRYDLLHQTPHPADGLPKQKGRIGDPTFATVAKLSASTRLEFLERTCSTVERCLAVLDYDIDRQRNKQRIVELLYWREGYTVEKVAQELNYSVRTVFMWKAEILKTIAEEMGYLA